MMAAQKKKPPLHVVESTEVRLPERQGLPKTSVYFPNQARLKECKDLVQEAYEAGELPSNSVSAFFYSLYCKYARERAQNARNKEG